MSGKAARFFTWLGVVAVLLFCWVASCIMMGATLSPEGRGKFRAAYRWADDVGGEEKGVRPPAQVNANYNVIYDEAGANPSFAGGSFALPLKAGFYPRPPAAEENKKPRFSYYLSNPGRTVEIRFRKDDEVEGEGGLYGEVTKKALFKHAEAYVKEIAGENALKGRPLRYAPPEVVARLGADAAVEGAYAYTPAERRRTGYGGEYFLMMNRGYRNVAVAAVAFKPYSREKAMAEGPALLEGFTYY